MPVDKGEWAKDYKSIIRLRNKILRGGRPTSSRELELHGKYTHYMPLYGKAYEEFVEGLERSKEVETKMVESGVPYQSREYSMPIFDIDDKLVGYTLPEDIDPEIREFVLDLNFSGISTEESCSGHGISSGWVILREVPNLETQARIRELGEAQGLRNFRFTKTKLGASKMGWLESPGGFPIVTFHIEKEING